MELTNEQIHEQLREIFARPEFGRGTRSPNFLDRFVMWLLESLEHLQNAAPLIYWAIVAGCIALLLLLAIYVIWAVRRMLFVSASRRQSETHDKERARRSLVYREEAGRRAQLGEFTEAIRYLFLSLVYCFDESGRVNFQQAYTNREYLALFADRPPLYADLKAFVDLLDEYWYGERLSSRQQYEECELRYEALSRG